jgi:hypothetical protein
MIAMELAPAVETICAVAMRPLPQGVIPHRGDLSWRPCPPTSVSESGLHWDSRAGTYRTTRPVSAGEAFGRIPETDTAVVVAGDELILQIQLGAVKIERAVKALQTCKSGLCLVRADDGEAFVSDLTSLRMR